MYTTQDGALKLEDLMRFVMYLGNPHGWKSAIRSCSVEMYSELDLHGTQEFKNIMIDDFQLTARSALEKWLTAKGDLAVQVDTEANTIVPIEAKTVPYFHGR